MSEAPPHPRDVFDLVGQQAAEAAFEDARARGRLHHAWLVTGPPGLGKATLSFRIARRLLGAAPDPGHGLLGAAPQDPVSRLVSQDAHPDLMVVDRTDSDGKVRREILVEEVRRLNEFFSKSPASAPYRVAIVDAADDLNRNAANAILKTLEEPPPRGVLLLVCHAPGRLIRTIRSRCRTLKLAPLPEDVVAGFVARRTGADPEQALRLARMSGGAPGRAWALASEGALEMDDAARALLQGLPDLDRTLALSLTDRFRGGEGARSFALLAERLAARVHDLVLRRAEEGIGGLDAWAEAWSTLDRLPREVEALNLDRAEALFTALADLRAAART
ncbi:DNA polymerase III subunit delta' [Phenylobacterium parvum]|uniref:DNA polymerase III subunit delta n=1 Tax=Phenylobacterium parvum TaxID=2201350 RepID=A0A2Z3HP12_9CAUL|nr:DNA polymerase III subunit delta' [Phenylobacterium parvum]AWM77467.1 DNA polymerase III subunit delta' [Phenylobacterium parvum]